MREDNLDVRRRHLQLFCPTCRHPFPAKPTLKGKVKTNIALKHMIELWEKECRMLNGSALVRMRSQATQTGTESPIMANNDDGSDISKENDITHAKLTTEYGHCKEGKGLVAFSEDLEVVDRVRPSKDYMDVLMKRVEEFLEECEGEAIEKSKPADTMEESMNLAHTLLLGGPTRFTNPRPATPGGGGGRSRAHTPSNMSTMGGDTAPDVSASEVDTISSSSSSSNDSSGNESTLAHHSNSEDLSIFERLGVPRMHLRAELSLGRLMLIFAWCIYAVVMLTLLGFGHTALPYTIISVFFIFLLFLG